MSARAPGDIAVIGGSSADNDEAARSEQGAGRRPRVCAWCNRVNIDGVWKRATVLERELAHVTHGICPECRAQAETALNTPQG